MAQQGIFKEQRVAVLVDVQNMYYSAKNLYNSKVKFEEILRDCVRGRVLVRALAYAIKADVKDESNFHEALENIGFEVKLKDLLIFYGGHKKGDWDIGIAMDAIRVADKVDVVVVVSGDGDFRELYELLRGRGCRVEVMAFGRTASSSVKDYVDHFIDMDKNKKYLIPLKNFNPNSQNGQTIINGGINLNPSQPIGNQPIQFMPNVQPATFNVKQTNRPLEASFHGQELSMKSSSPVTKQAGDFDILKVNQDQPDTFNQPGNGSSGIQEINAGNSNARKSFHGSDQRRRFNSPNQYRGGNNSNRYKNTRSRQPLPVQGNPLPAKKIETVSAPATAPAQAPAKIIEQKQPVQKESKSEGGLFNKLIKKMKK